MRSFFTYILTNRARGALYIGVTSHPRQRIAEHRSGKGSNFPKRYNLFTLVHIEKFDKPELAIQRETSLKRWKREWKISLIEERNPYWEDLLLSKRTEKIPASRA